MIKYVLSLRAKKATSLLAWHSPKMQKFIFMVIHSKVKIKQNLMKHTFALCTNSKCYECVATI